MMWYFDQWSLYMYNIIVISKDRIYFKMFKKSTMYCISIAMYLKLSE